MVLTSYLQPTKWKFSTKKSSSVTHKQGIIYLIHFTKPFKSKFEGRRTINNYKNPSRLMVNLQLKISYGVKWKSYQRKLIIWSCGLKTRWRRLQLQFVIKEVNHIKLMELSPV